MRNQLKILQYNTHSSKDEVLAPLLADTRVHDFDILAVQEPWENRQVLTGYNPSSSRFTLCYPPFRGSRVCLYVNKRLDINNWRVTFHSGDVLTATIDTTLRGKPSKTLIHNVYNPSPLNRHVRESITIATVRKCLEMDGDRHILLGDFNLHHPLWEGPTRGRQHKMADTLLDITTKEDLRLLTTAGEPTWRVKGAESVLDLTFLSNIANHDLLRHDIRHDLDQGSDHTPIETTIRIGLQENVTRRQRD